MPRRPLNLSNLTPDAKLPKKLSKSDIKEIFILYSKFAPDNYGHLKLTKQNNGTNVLYRLKFQDLSLRYERQLIFSNGDKEWRNIRTVYYKDIKPVFENDKIIGVTFGDDKVFKFSN